MQLSLWVALYFTCHAGMTPSPPGKNGNALIMLGVIRFRLDLEQGDGIFCLRMTKTHDSLYMAKLQAPLRSGRPATLSVHHLGDALAFGKIPALACYASDGQPRAQDIRLNRWQRGRHGNVPDFATNKRHSGILAST